MLTMATASASALTVNDLTGSYNETATGKESFSSGDWTWTENAGTYPVTIVATGDNTVSIKNLRGYGETFYGTVDFDNKTITIPASNTSYYVFCSYDPETFTTTGSDAIIATFNDDATEIVIKNWAYTYNGGIYAYGTSTLQKNLELWKLPATYDNGEWGSGKCTIVAYATHFTVVDWPVAGYALSFTFDPTTQTVALLNADYEPEPEYPGYWYYCVTSSTDCLGIYTEDGMSSLVLTETGGTFTLSYEWYADYNDENPIYSGEAKITWPDVDGIAGVTADKKVAQKGFFDLNGRRITSPAGKKGLIISDGKKFIAK